MVWPFSLLRRKKKVDAILGVDLDTPRRRESRLTYMPGEPRFPPGMYESHAPLAVVPLPLNRGSPTCQVHPSGWLWAIALRVV